MILRMTRVMSRPMIGSAASTPRATTPALATTPSETKPSTRAWLPSATRAGLARRRPGAQPDLGGDLVADEADQPGEREHPQVRELLWVDQALDCLVGRDTGGDEDREDDGEAGELLTAGGAEEERDAEWDGGERVADVVDQVGEQRYRAGEEEDGGLGERGQREHAEAQRDRLDPLARAEDRTIDEAVRMAVLARAPVVVIVTVLVVVSMAVVVGIGLVSPWATTSRGVRMAHEASVIGSG